MKLPICGAIDCDLHPSLPSVPALRPYLDEFWADQFANRHIDQLSFTLSSYPTTSPLSGRSDWRTASGMPDADLDALRRNVLDPLALGCAICNPLHGAVALFNDDMAAALCAAINDWVAKELLDREPRLRASILVAGQTPSSPCARSNAAPRIAGSCRFCCSQWARHPWDGASTGRSMPQQKSMNW